MATQHSMRTPLKEVRKLGSAKDGTEHFWKQRLTAVANLVLVPICLGLVIWLAGADHATLKRAFANPLIPLAFGALVLSGTYHMRLGMQVIIEDYVPGDLARIIFIMLNTFFAVLVALASLFAIAKLSLGA